MDGAGHSLGYPSVGDCVVDVLVDSGMVRLQPLLRGGGEATQASLEAVLGAPVPTTVGADVLLRAAFSAEQWWLVRQLLSEFTCAVAAFDKEKEWTTNPLDEDSGFACGKNRADPEVDDRLMSGTGASGSTAVARNGLAHRRFFFMLKRPTAAAGHGRGYFGRLCMRYKAVGEEALAGVHHMALSSDGTRASGKDNVYIMALWRRTSGEWASMWFPPQASRRRLFPNKYLKKTKSLVFFFYVFFF